MSGLKFGDAMPGGFDACDLVLPRKPNIDYSDLERLSTLTVHGAGGGVAGQYRLERAPRVSGNEMSVAPNCVGWQAHLEDDKSVQEVYVDRDPSHWTQTTLARRIVLAGLSIVLDKDYTASVDRGVMFSGVSGQAISSNSRAELNYSAPPGCAVSKIMYLGAERNLTSITAATLYSDDNATGSSQTSTGLTLDSTLRTATPATAERYLWLAAIASGTHTPAAAAPFSREFPGLGVYGNSGVTTRTISATEPDGVYASDVIANAVSRWAPRLSYTTGANGTIQSTAFAVPQLAWPDPTTVATIIQEANRFHLNDWAVWEGPTFHYHERGARGREWRARVVPTRLEEAGPQVDRLWNGVIVQYRDVDGTTKTVGPTGASTDSTSASLIDTSPENPANQLGIRRWTILDMGIVSTPEAATEVGKRFLEESMQLDRSGKATIVGYCEDSKGKGIPRPYHQMQSGDTISFVDASDPSPRRIVKTTKDYDSRTCEIDLDAPPEGLDALLERLGVVLIPLGL